MGGDARGSSADELVDEGLEAYGAGKEERAIAAWRRALELDPENAQAREYLEVAGVDVPSLAEVVPLHPPSEGGVPPTPDYRQEIVSAVQANDLERGLDLIYRARAIHPEDSSLSLSLRHIKKKLTARYERRIGDMDAVAARTSEQPATELTDNELAVLALVDGIVSFADVIDSSKRGRFQTLRALTVLLDAGILGVADHARTRSHPAPSPVRTLHAPSSPAEVDVEEEASGLPWDASRAERAADMGVEQKPSSGDSYRDALRARSAFYVGRGSVQPPPPSGESYEEALRMGTLALEVANYVEAERCFLICLERRPGDWLAKENLERARVKKPSE
ncbi:MAG: hypothetical protein DRJ42_17785 [Deltaproteobacteria bacterium]|nr:MAG: hypothetical protein DRJ42_17785 [Deltaproteobacteria bacterium]